MLKWVLMVSAALVPASAAPLFFVESTDLSGTSSANIGTLGVGLNSISGTLNGAPTIGDLSDLFAVTLPTGLVIIAGQVTVTNFHYGAGAIQTALPFTDPVGGTQTFLANGVYLLTLNLPFTALFETMSFAANGPFSENSGPTVYFAGGYDYTIEYTVIDSAVPEPSAAGLIGLGLAAILAMCRRSHKSTNA